jgi:hypothetical protein
MPTTNFQLFDPGYVNAASDAQYTADGSRSGGFAVDAIVTSPLLNKFMVQASQMYTALATMLLNKGFSTSDANQAALVSALANIQTTADGRNPLLGVVYSATYNFNLAASAAFEMQLAGNLTSPTFSGLTPGITVTFVWQQDSVGSRTITYGSSFYNPGPAQPDPTPNAVSIQSFMCMADGILRPTGPMTVTAD